MIKEDNLIKYRTIFTLVYKTPNAAIFNMILEIQQFNIKISPISHSICAIDRNNSFGAQNIIFMQTHWMKRVNLLHFLFRSMNTMSQRGMVINLEKHLNF